MHTLYQNEKPRPKTRFDRAMMLLLNNTWQGCQSLKITFDDKDIECDVKEIRGLLEAKPKSHET